MGYCHYVRRPKEIDSLAYAHIVHDFRKLLPVLEAAGVRIAGPAGDGDPVIGPDSIRFNGISACGHMQNEGISIAWPAETAQGIAEFAEDPVSGSWFAGGLLSKRACSGNCSHESFFFDQTYEPFNENDHPDNDGLYFEFCKTAYKPYDLACLCVLVIAKHYLRDKIKVMSDGEQIQWMDGMLLCEQHLGYGVGFILDKEE